jgi:hypothetical protein
VSASVIGVSKIGRRRSEHVEGCINGLFDVQATTRGLRWFWVSKRTQSIATLSAILVVDYNKFFSVPQILVFVDDPLPEVIGTFNPTMLASKCFWSDAMFVGSISMGTVKKKKHYRFPVPVRGGKVQGG